MEEAEEEVKEEEEEKEKEEEEANVCMYTMRKQSGNESPEEEEPRPAPRGALSALQIYTTSQPRSIATGVQRAGTHRLLGRLQLRELILQVPHRTRWQRRAAVLRGGAEVCAEGCG